MTPPPKNFSLVLTGPNAFDKDIDVWGYGYKGYAYVNNGKYICLVKKRHYLKRVIMLFY